MIFVFNIINYISIMNHGIYNKLSQGTIFRYFKV